MNDTETQPRCGDWILTGSGRRFYPIDPRPEDVSIDDIARSLSNQCRWTGHTRFHYSIAQHACFVSAVVERIMPSLALAALHHDSGEAYIGDIARPWKRMLAVREAQAGGVAAFGSIEFAEKRILAAILEALAIPAVSDEEWRMVQVVDNRVLRTEFEQLLPADDAPGWSSLGDSVPGVTIWPMDPEDAMAAFLHTHERLINALAVAP
jgi:uncharacterized protein